MAPILSFSAHRQKMSFQSESQVPKFPEIDDFSILFDVCTHKNIKPTSPGEPCGWTDSDRLMELGAQVLNSVITSHFFHKRPYIRGEEMKTLRDHWTSPERLNEWLDQYDLKSKLRTLPDERDTVLDDVHQMAEYFHSYVGGIFVVKGLEPIQAWISKLIDPDSVIVSATPNQRPSNQSSPPQAEQKGPVTAPTPYYVSVAMLNQLGTHKKIPIDYAYTREGLDHDPTFTVECSVDNVVKGKAEGKTLKAAKEDAARSALVAMGWL